MQHSKRSYRKGNPRGTRAQFNGRKFSKYDRVGIQRHALRLYESEDLHPERIAQMLRVSVRSVYRWISWYKARGWQAFSFPRPSRKCKLNEEQLVEIILLVLTKTPLELGYTTTLWTRKLISEEIFKRFALELSETSVGRILKRNRITPQKPIRRAYQQDKQAVERFKTETFPALVAKAKAEGALIVWLDETQAVSDPNVGRTWGKSGETPVILANGSKEKLNVIGTVDQNGRTDFMTYEGNTDTSVVIAYIEQLAKKRKEKIYLILDNAPYHKSKELIEYIEAHHKGWLELIHLPPYSPELNPTELIWAHLKSHGLNRVLTKTRDSFLVTVEQHLCKFINNFSMGLALFGKKELAFIGENIPTLQAA